MAALFMCREKKLNDEQKECLERIREADPALADARRPTRELNGMVRNLEGGKLDGWLAEDEVCAAPTMRRRADLFLPPPVGARADRSPMLRSRFSG